MKAIKIHEYGEPEVMKYEDTKNLTPDPGQVLIHVKAAGVNPVDTYIRSGTYAVKPALPYTPGTDSGGVIEEIGEGISLFRSGDRVYTSGSISGTYAEYALCREKDVHQLPPNISLEQGAALGIPYATAYCALFLKAKAKKGEFVFIHGGTGGVGTACIQLALSAGLDIISTGGTEKGMALLSSQGVKHVLNHNSSDYMEQINDLTKNHGINIIIEMLANVNLSNDLTVLAREGRIVIIGNRGSIEINPRFIMIKDAIIRGMVLFNLTEPELKNIHAALIDGLSKGTLKPVIGKQFSLKEAPIAHKTIMEPGSYGKIILVP